MLENITILKEHIIKVKDVLNLKLYKQSQLFNPKKVCPEAIAW